MGPTLTQTPPNLLLLWVSLAYSLFPEGLLAWLWLKACVERTSLSRNMPHALITVHTSWSLTMTVRRCSHDVADVKREPVFNARHGVYRTCQHGSNCVGYQLQNESWWGDSWTLWQLFVWFRICWNLKGPLRSVKLRKETREVGIRSWKVGTGWEGRRLVGTVT